MSVRRHESHLRVGSDNELFHRLALLDAARVIGKGMLLIEYFRWDLGQMVSLCDTLVNLNLDLIELGASLILT